MSNFFLIDLLASFIVFMKYKKIPNFVPAKQTEWIDKKENVWNTKPKRV